MLLQLFFEQTFGHSAHLLVNDFTVFNEEHGGNVADTVFHGDFRVFIHVHLADERLAVIFLCKFFHDGRDCAAGSAPLSPKVNEGNFSAFR